MAISIHLGRVQTNNTELADRWLPPSSAGTSESCICSCSFLCCHKVDSQLKGECYCWVHVDASCVDLNSMLGGMVSEFLVDIDCIRSFVA
jgi:hypothetical protein